MRWFPDRLIVLLDEVQIDIYTLVIECSFFRNALTLLHVILPPQETESQLSFWYEIKLKGMRQIYNCTGLTIY